MALVNAKTSLCFFRLCKKYLGNIHLKCRLFCNAASDSPYLQDKFVGFIRQNSRYRSYTFHQEDYEYNFSKFNQNSVHLPKDVIASIDIPELLCFLNSCDTKSIEMHYFIQCADERCSIELNNMSRSLVCKCIDVWYSLYQENITNSLVFTQFVNLSHDWLHSNRSQLEELIFIMFFISMMKKHHQTQKIVRNCLHRIGNNVCHLSADELCIVISSSFKVSAKIKSKETLKYICDFTQKNLKSLVSDPGYLVTIVKGLRHAKFHDFKLMDEMASKKYSSSISNMNFIAKVHILALYADALYDKQPFVPELIKSCVKYVSLFAPDSSVLRVKDVSRLLWAISYLGCEISSEDRISVSQYLGYWISVKNSKNVEHIISCLLSLWMIGNRSDVLFNAAVIQNLTRQLKDTSGFRSKSRLCLLLTGMQIEMPEILSEKSIDWKVNNILPPRLVQEQIKRREFLQHLYAATSNLSSVMNIQVSCGCFLPNINIAGITTQSKRGNVLHFEVLDKGVCLHNSFQPNGIMKFKLHLLESLGHEVLAIPEDRFDVVNNPSNLYEFIEEQLKKLEKRKNNSSLI